MGKTRLPGSRNQLLLPLRARGKIQPPPHRASQGQTPLSVPRQLADDAFMEKTELLLRVAGWVDAVRHAAFLIFFTAAAGAGLISSDGHIRSWKKDGMELPLFWYA